MNYNSYLAILRTDNGTEFKNSIMSHDLREIFSIFLELPFPTIPVCYRTAKRTVQEFFLTFAENHKKDNYILNDFIFDFLL